MNTEPRQLIVDASVAVKWFLAEGDSDEAARLLDNRFRLQAPALLRTEVANALWKETRAGGISPEEALARVEALAQFPVALHQTADLLPEALKLAIETDRTVYDSVYLALALRESALLVTADARFLGGLAGSEYARRICHLADMDLASDGE